MWAIGMVHWMYDTKCKPENRYGVIPISRYSGSKLILQRNSCSQIPLKALVACWFKLFPVYYKSLIPNARAQEVPWPYPNMSLGHTGHYIMILNYFSAFKYDGFVIFCSFAPWRSKENVTFSWFSKSNIFTFSCVISKRIDREFWDCARFEENSM